MVTDYDCWREDGACVVATDIVTQMHASAATARRVVRAFVEALPAERTPSPIDTVLDQAILTAPGAQDTALAAKLDAILTRFTASRAT
jgi:5'-methylthioadenosine phosphorylase